MRHYVLAACAALTLVACGGGDTVTGPLPTTHQPVVSNPAPSTSTPTVVADPTPEPGGGPGVVSVNCQADGCHLSNAGQAPHSVTIACTEPLQTDPVYGLTKVTVPVGSDTLIIGPKSVCDKDLPEVRCEDVTRDVQIDFTAGAGEHIGHLLTKLTWENNAEDQWVLKDNEPVITYEYGEWGECQPLPEEVVVSNHNDPPPTCTHEHPGVQYQSVVKITTVSHYWFNQCGLQEEREVPKPDVTRTEQPDNSQPCTYTTEDQCGLCYYNVPGKLGFFECISKPGYVSWNEQNHLCSLTFPGVSDRHFELNPGQSEEGCLDKHDD